MRFCKFFVVTFFQRNMSSKGFHNRGNDRTIVIIGKTGEGKSALGNTLLQEEWFYSDMSADSLTKRTSYKMVQLTGKNVRVIDTPGLFDTRNQGNSDWLVKEIQKCIYLSVPGPHAFLVVMRPDRITKESVDTLTQVLKLFGKQIYKHIILVFTHLNDFGSTNSSRKERIEKFDAYLKTVSKGSYFEEFRLKCEDRILAVDNKLGTPDENNTFIEKLMNMPFLQNDEYYTNPVLEEATKTFFDRVEELLPTTKSYEEAVQSVLKEVEKGIFFRKIATSGGVGAGVAAVALGITAACGLPVAGVVASAGLFGGVGGAVTYKTYDSCTIL